MKLRIIIALLLSAILSSCSSMTKAFVSDTAWDDSLSVVEKLLAFGGGKAQEFPSEVVADHKRPKVDNIRLGSKQRLELFDV